MKKLLVVVAAALSACAMSVAVTLPTAPTEAAPALRLPSDVVPRAYRLDYDARPGNPRFTGHVQIDVHLAQPRQTLWLHARQLDVARVSVHQGEKTLAARLLAPNDDGLAALVVAEPVAAGDATLDLEFSGAYGAKTEGFYKATVQGTPYLFTQFEDTSARLAFPCFDEPGLKAPLTLTLTVDANDLAFSNTPVAQEEAVDGGKRVRFGPTEALSTYLYAWAVGTFDVVDGPTIPASSLRPQPVPLRGIAVKGQSGQLGIALDEMQKLVLSEEKYFGLPYPWAKLDLVAVPDFEAGAMENVGLITFRDTVLQLDPAHATPAQLKDMVRDEAHELAHQWFGDLVTMAWWDDVWLNEAFASWMEDRTAEEVHPELGIPLQRAREVEWAMYTDRLSAARQIHQPVVKTADIHNAFDAITYHKGAAVIGMFEHWMGTALFQAGIHSYLVAHAHGNATIDDLLGALTQAAGKDVATPFRSFLDQPGIPLIQGELTCSGTGAQLALKQTRYLPLGSSAPRELRWQVPVCVRAGRGSTSEVGCTLLTDTTGVLSLGKTCPTWVQLDADQAGYYRWTLPGKDLHTVAQAKLGDLDRFAVTSAIRAGDDASVISPSDALSALTPFVIDDERQISGAWAGEAGEVLQNQAEDSWRPLIRQRAAQLYAPQVAKLGLAPKPGESDSASEERVLAVTTVAQMGRDPQVGAALAKLGRAYLGLDSDRKTHRDAVTPDLASLAVQQALEATPSEAAATIERFQLETDPALRRILLDGIDQVRDPAAATLARALALDPRTRSNEVFEPYWAQMWNYQTRDAAWVDLRAHFEALAAREGDQFAFYLPFLVGNPCSEAGAQEVEAFLGPKAAANANLKHGLDESLESIRLCAARAAAQRDDAKRYFTAPAAK